MNEDVGRVIAILSNQIKRYIDRTASAHGMTGAQGRVLHFILLRSKDGEVFQKDIEEEFNLRRSTASGILQLMEKNGMIRRESVPYDARLKSIKRTEKAMKLQEQVIADIQDLEAALTQNLEQDDLQIFFKVMKQMTKNIDM